MPVFVYDNDVNATLRLLEKKMQRAGRRELKRRRS